MREKLENVLEMVPVNGNGKKNHNGNGKEKTKMESYNRNGKRQYTNINTGVIGFGVVGSATANRLYELGNDVHVSDVRPPEELEGWKNEYHFMQEYDLSKTDATFLILPTPSEEERLFKGMHWDDRRRRVEGMFGQSLDKSICNSVVEGLAEKMKAYDGHHLFIVRSTVEPGTTRNYGKEIERLSGKKMGEDFSMAMIPEFLRAFSNIEDEINAKMYIVGHHDERGLDLVKRIYQHLPKNSDGESIIYPMNLEEAELVKMENNAINAIWISLHNSREEFYELLGAKGISIDYPKMTTVLSTLTEAFTSRHYGTKAGIPFGGTCLKKDPNALHAWAEDEMGVQCYLTRILGDIIQQNLHLQKRVFNAHNIPETTKGSLEALSSRDHSTYDNIKKTREAVEEAADFK